MTKVRRTKGEPAAAPGALAPTSTTAMAEAMVSAGVVPAPTPTAAPATRAGLREYDSFFRVYAEVVRASSRATLNEALSGEGDGLYFLPLGFIPGPACLLQFKGDQVRILETTPDVRHGLPEVPSDWVSFKETQEGVPDAIWYALGEWSGLVKGLGHEPSPWNVAFARRTLEGEAPLFLAMALPRFRYRTGDAEVPFGVVLTPGKASGMQISRVLNPGNIPGVPEEADVLSHEDLKWEKGPVQKLLRTWALMESNFASRYKRDGRPHDHHRGGRNSGHRDRDRR